MAWGNQYEMLPPPQGSHLALQANPGVGRFNSVVNYTEGVLWSGVKGCAPQGFRKDFYRRSP